MSAALSIDTTDPIALLAAIPRAPDETWSLEQVDDAHYWASITGDRHMDDARGSTPLAAVLALVEVRRAHPPEVLRGR